MIALAAAPPSARAVALARPLTRLCALPPDLGWARAWTRALPRATRERVRVDLLSGRRLTLADPCRGGFAAGPAAASLAPPGPLGLAAPLAAAGYLAGSMIGASLAAAGRAGVVQVAGPLLPSPANEALFAGLAQGLGQAAPSGTILTVGGRTAAQATVRLDSARPQGLVRWRGSDVDGRCQAVEGALAARLEDAMRHQTPPAGAPAALVRCGASPATAAADAALAAARARLEAGFRPATLPDFTRPPLAVAPWQRAGARAGARQAEPAPRRSRHRRRH